MAGIGNAFDRKDPETAIAMIQSKMKDIDTIQNNTNEFLDMFYPVGSYYETSDSAFDPNVSWGGTWELESGGNVHIGAGGNYSIGGTGGAAEVTLTASQSGMPSHGHSYSSPSVQDGGAISKTLTGSHSHPATNSYKYAVYNSTKGLSERTFDSTGSAGSYKGPIVSDSSAGWYGHNYTGSADVSLSLSVSAHSHTLSGGSVSDASAQNASSAHNNMQPYIVVNRWHRTA